MILEEWPERLVTHWRAVYDKEPWDAQNRRALAECKYMAPDYNVPGKQMKRRRMNGTEY